MSDLLQISQMQADEAFAGGCPECVASGGSWVHLRMCLVCGKVGCCDSSPATHATKHFQQSGHPVVRSIEPGEAWRWSYETRRYSL